MSVYYGNAPPNPNTMFQQMYAICKEHTGCHECPIDKGRIFEPQESNGGKYVCITGANRYINEQKSRATTNKDNKTADDNN